MKVGVELPLLSRRFRYLRLLGEGTSAQVCKAFSLLQYSLCLPRHAGFSTWLHAVQVILAEDMYSQNSKLVVIKVLKRHFGTVGQKVPPKTVPSCPCMPAVPTLALLTITGNTGGYRK